MRTTHLWRSQSIIEICQVEGAIRRREVLREPFTSIAHQVVYRYERLEYDDPRSVLRSLDEEIRQLRNRDIGLVCAMKQI